MKLSLILLTLVLQLLSCAIYGQSIEGYIYGADDRNPLIGAHVISLSDWSNSSVTDVEGKFVLTKPASVDDTLLISFIGYQELNYPVSAFEDGEIIWLQPNEQVIEAVVVSAEKIIAEEFSSQKIKRLDIYKNPSSKADPILAVNSLPSTTTADESANVSFRGSGPGETGVFLDGVPIYDFVRFAQLNGIGTLSVFNTDLVGSVQVFPGNPPLEFGNVSSGLIAIETSEIIPENKPKTLTLSLASVGGNFTTAIGKNQRLHVYANYQPSGVFRALNEAALEDILKFESAESGVQYVNQINDKWKLKLFNYAQLEGFDFNYQTPTLSTVFEQNKTRNLSTLNISRSFRWSRIKLLAGSNFSDVSFTYGRTDISIQNRDVYGAINYQFEIGKIGMKSGVSFDYRRQLFSGLVPEYAFAERNEDPHINVESDNSRTVQESFSYFKYDITPKLVAGIALRKNFPSKNKRNYLARQINLSYQLSSKWKLNAAYGTFYRSILSQTEDQGFELIENTQSSLDIFFNDTNIDFSFSTFHKGIERSVNEEQIFGVEIAHSYRLSKLKYNIAYTFLNARVDENELVYEGAFDFDYFFKVGLEWNLTPEWTLGARGLFRPGSHFNTVTEAIFREDLGAFEPTFVDNENREMLNSYNIIDLNISKLQSINEKLGAVFFASASNVFDIANQRTFTYSFDYETRTTSYFSRRTVYFGVALNFL